MLDLDNSKNIDTLRLDDKSLATLYTNLDKRKTGVPNDGTGHRTKPIRAVLGIIGADSQVTPYNVAVRYIGPTWCTVLIGMYTHPDQQATITIPTHTGEKQSFEATVVDCAHVAGKIHESKIELETNIEITEFIGTGPTMASMQKPSVLGPSSSAQQMPRMPESADISALLEILSQVGMDDSDAAFRGLLDVILIQAQRHGLDSVKEATQEILGLTSSGKPDLSALTALETAVQTLSGPE